MRNLIFSVPQSNNPFLEPGTQQPAGNLFPPEKLLFIQRQGIPASSPRKIQLFFEGGGSFTKRYSKKGKLITPKILGLLANNN